jgi:hypothetical protein
LHAAHGVSILASFPLWTVFHHFHGLATTEFVAPQFRASLDAAKSALPEVYRAATAISVLDSQVSTVGPEAEYVVRSLTNVLFSVLVEKLDAFDGFKAEIQRVPARQRLPLDRLRQRVEERRFWRVQRGSLVEVGLEGVDAPPDDAKFFDYWGPISYEGTEKSHERSFHALPEAWEMLIQFFRLVSQSGFASILTAASNPRGGRHPPHDTHRSGIDFDLDWGYVDGPSRVPNLARRKKRFGKGRLLDLERDEVFELILDPRDQSVQEKQIRMPLVATLVVLQAAALSGLRRYLYVDTDAMSYAANQLGLLIDASLSGARRGTRNIPVAEGLAHYNHLHAEAKDLRSPQRDRQPTSAFLSKEQLSKLYAHALLRDTDPRFQKELTAPWYFTPAEQGRVDEFAKKWMQRSNDGKPALLPLWGVEDPARPFLDEE